MAHGLRPDEAIARIADWKGEEVRWEELGGGITNRNYIVGVNGGWGNPGGGESCCAYPAWAPTCSSTVTSSASA